MSPNCHVCDVDAHQTDKLVCHEIHLFYRYKYISSTFRAFVGLLNSKIAHVEHNNFEHVAHNLNDDARCYADDFRCSLILFAN